MKIPNSSKRGSIADGSKRSITPGHTPPSMKRLGKKGRESACIDKIATCRLQTIQGRSDNRIPLRRIDTNKIDKTTKKTTSKNEKSSPSITASEEETFERYEPNPFQQMKSIVGAVNKLCALHTRTSNQHNEKTCPRDQAATGGHSEKESKDSQKDTTYKLQMRVMKNKAFLTFLKNHPAVTTCSRPYSYPDEITSGMIVNNCDFEAPDPDIEQQKESEKKLPGIEQNVKKQKKSNKNLTDNLPDQRRNVETKRQKDMIEQDEFILFLKNHPSSNRTIIGRPYSDLLEFERKKKSNQEEKRKENTTTGLR